jgi:murein DD-endopeptidase MepM/ murein hydrolase activator NlpD
VALGQGVLAVLLAVILIGGPGSEAAQAQDGSDSSTTTEPTSSTVDETVSTTTEPDPAQASSEPETTTSRPSSTDESSTSTLEPGNEGSTTTEPVGQPEEEGSTTTIVDPLVDEAPVEDSLDPNVTVPPPTGADVNPDFAPSPILWSNVRAAEAKWADAVTAKVEAISRVRSLRLRTKELARDKQQLEEQTRLTIDELTEATKRLQGRAIRGFLHTAAGNGTATELGPDALRYRDLVVHQRKTRLVNAVIDVDESSMEDLAALQSSLGTSAVELVERTRIVVSGLRTAESEAVELAGHVDQARIELEAFKAGSDIYVDGVVFPIAGPYSVPLINSFGFPRMPGTPDEHWHEGIDIFAPRGTPLVAAERGVLGRIGNGRLGGLKLWLRGESGADWYYAHLDGFAPGIHNGQVVEAGQLLGYVGNTGNAVGTPPHLHMEIHPGGGRAVNPYPLLKVVSDLDLKSYVDGVHPGFRYQPVIASQPETTTTTSETTTTAPSTNSTNSTAPTTAPTSSAQSSSPTTSAESSQPTEPSPTTATDSDKPTSELASTSDPPATTGSGGG